MNPALLIGGAAVVLLAGGKKKPRGKSARACPALQPGGGTLAGFDYLEFTTGGAKLTDSLPIVICFHGLGSKPETLVKFFDGIHQRARIVLPTGREKYGSGPAWWPLRSNTKDQDTLAAQMGSEGAAMAEFVEQANRCLGGVGKPVITGHSQGGMMTYATAAADPGVARAAVAVSGWLPTKLWPRSLPPTHAIHGTEDRTVKYARTEDFILRAQAAGLPIKWTPVPGKAHGFGGATKEAWEGSVRSLLK